MDMDICGLENKGDVYRGWDCIKIFCETLREHSMKVINFEKMKIIKLTNEQQQSYKSQNSVKFQKIKIKNVLT